MGDAVRSSMSRSMHVGSPRKDNTEEVAKRRAAMQRELEQRREEARRLQDEKMARAAAQKEERLQRQRDMQQKEAQRMQAAQQRRNAALAEEKLRKTAAIAKAEHAAARHPVQQKARPVYAFGSSTPRELGYLTQLSKQQQVYDRKLQPSFGGVSSPVLNSSRRFSNSRSNQMSRSMYIPGSQQVRCANGRLLNTSMTRSVISPQQLSRNSPVNSSTPRHTPVRDSSFRRPITTNNSAATQRIDTKHALGVSSSKSIKNIPPKKIKDKSEDTSNRNRTSNNGFVRKKNSLENISIVKETDTLTDTLVESNDANLGEVQQPVAHLVNQSVLPSSQISSYKEKGKDGTGDIETAMDNQIAEITKALVGITLSSKKESGSEAKKVDLKSETIFIEGEDTIRMGVNAIVKELTDAVIESQSALSTEITKPLVLEGIVKKSLIEKPHLSFEGSVNSINEVPCFENTKDVVLNEISPKLEITSKSSESSILKVADEEAIDKNSDVGRKTETMHLPAKKSLQEVGEKSSETELKEKQVPGLMTEEILSVVKSEASYLETSKADVRQNEMDSARTTDQLKRQKRDDGIEFTEGHERVRDSKFEEAQREREMRKARLQAIMTRTRGTPTAVVTPTTQVVPKDFVKENGAPETNDSHRVTTISTASILQKLASSKPQLISSKPHLLSLLQRNGSNPSLAEELSAADQRSHSYAHSNESLNVNENNTIHAFDGDKEQQRSIAMI